MLSAIFWASATIFAAAVLWTGVDRIARRAGLARPDGGCGADCGGCKLAALCARRMDEE